MFYLKACEKCHGDLYLEKDMYGSFLECIQCGSVKDVAVSENFGAFTSQQGTLQVPGKQLQASAA